jgi:hypothetical protein
MSPRVPRKTKHDYDAPGSFARLLEAALAVANVDAESKSDAAFHAACARLRNSAISYAAHRPAHVLEAARLQGGEARSPEPSNAA